MFRLAYLLIPISLTVLLILSACGGELGPQEGTIGASSRDDQASLAPSQETLYSVDVVKTLTPSVVQILTEALTMGAFNQPVPGMGVGTGVILDEQGHILTNNHVIAGAQRITVTLRNGDSFPAQVVGGDAHNPIENHLSIFLWETECC